MNIVERLSVLAVEDEAMIAFELEDMLKELGHEVIGPVATVEAALRLLKSSTPDAAIVDANLGGVSAKPLVDLLKVVGVPVVLVSGYEAGALHALGFDVPLVRKPYSNVDLAKALEMVCSAQSRRDRLE